MGLGEIFASQTLPIRSMDGKSGIDRRRKPLFCKTLFCMYGECAVQTGYLPGCFFVGQVYQFIPEADQF
jgi:hypothetical protein